MVAVLFVYADAIFTLVRLSTLRSMDGSSMHFSIITKERLGYRSRCSEMVLYLRISTILGP